MKYFSPLLFALALFTALNAQSQCRTFVKNNCGETMTGYTVAENFNAAKLMPGDEAELAMTFSKGEAYRLFICAQSILDNVEFQISDTDKNVLFDNREHELIDHFDFRVPDTQELLINVKVGESKTKGISPQGCVAVMLGKKITP